MWIPTADIGGKLRDDKHKHLCRFGDTILTASDDGLLVLRIFFIELQ